MDSLQNLAKQWASLPNRHEKYNFYTNKILPVVAHSLHQQLLQYTTSHHLQQYISLVTILSHNIHPTLLAITSIRPQHCVIFYTSEKSKALKKVLEVLQNLSIHIETIELDRVHHHDNIAIINRYLKYYKRHYSPVLCDITGGKKIMSTNIGIIAQALKVDIAYIDSKDEYIQWGIPQPGNEVLYIQHPNSIINQFESNPLNKLRISYDAESSTLTFQADIGTRSYNLGSKKIKSGEKTTISESLSNFYTLIDSSILYQNYGLYNELNTIQSAIAGFLFTNELKKFLKENKCNKLHLVMDEEVSSIPWELVLQQYNISLPIIRIPNRNREFSESFVTYKPNKIALIIGSDHGISGFESFINHLKFSLSQYKDTSLKTIDASDSNKLKLFFAKHSYDPFEIIIYYGHAVFGKDHTTSGLVCKDNSIFSTEDCEVFESAPCKCMIVNACQSARGNIFEKNSFAYAALKAGVDTYIGTHFFLESQRSFLFIKTFLQQVLQNSSYLEAFNCSLQALEKEYGANDISLYNYIYYGG